MRVGSWKGTPCTEYQIKRKKKPASSFPFNQWIDTCPCLNMSISFIDSLSVDSFLVPVYSSYPERNPVGSRNESKYVLYCWVGLRYSLTYSSEVSWWWGCLVPSGSGCWEPKSGQSVILLMVCWFWFQFDIWHDQLSIPHFLFELGGTGSQ